jgi:hypothetical protein
LQLGEQEVFMPRVIRPLLLLGVAMGWIAGSAGAQDRETATTLAELSLKVGAGDIVFVTTGDGRERRARILQLSPKSMVVTIDGTRTEMSEESLKTVRQQTSDPLSNGAMFGAVGGLGALFMLVRSYGDIEDVTQFLVMGGAIGGGLGALVGMGIDAAIAGKATIYERRAARNIVVQPILAAKAKGFVIGFQF